MGRPIETSEPIHEFFGLSYASHIVLPRSALQSMPKDWQAKFVALVEQLHDTLDLSEMPPEFMVRGRDFSGKFVEDPYSAYNRGRRQLPLREVRGA